MNQEQASTNSPIPSVAINSQYIKDLSFENSGSHELLKESKSPNIEISLNIEAKSNGENNFEVALEIKAHAKIEEKTLFLVELTYAGTFILNNIPESDRELVLLIHCPTILFPFARRVIADVTRDGAYQPLMLDPIDFAMLYQQRKDQQKSEAN